MVSAIPATSRLPRALLQLAVLAILAAGVPVRVAAQAGAAAADSAQVLLAEHRFSGDSAERVVVTLERGVVYRAEVDGPGTLFIEHARRGAPPAFLVPVPAGAPGGPRRFEVYAVRAGVHAAGLAGLAPGDVATLRIYRDASLTRDIAARRDRATALGLQVVAGWHTGYRLDPTGGADPGGGTDLEGCLLVESTARMGTCLGLGREALPDAGYSVTWTFIEGRVRLWSGHLIATRRSDAGVTLRFSHALEAGPRSLTPNLLSFGLYFVQRLAAGGHRRGWGLVVGWQHGRLGYVPETELLDMDRFTAGLAWLP